MQMDLDLSPFCISEFDFLKSQLDGTAVSPRPRGALGRQQASATPHAGMSRQLAVAGLGVGVAAAACLLGRGPGPVMIPASPAPAAEPSSAAAGAMGLDFTRDGCGGAANSWGGGDWPWISISVILPTYTISQGRACPTSVCAMRACGNTDCSSVAVLRVKKRGLYIDMSMYGVFDTSPPTFQSTPSLLPRLLRRTTPLRTLVSCVFNRLRLTLPSTTACKVHQHKRVTYIML